MQGERGRDARTEEKGCDGEVYVKWRWAPKSVYFSAKGKEE